MGFLDFAGQVTQRRKMARVSNARNSITDHVVVKGGAIRAWPAFFPYVLYRDDTVKNPPLDQKLVRLEVRYPCKFTFRGWIDGGAEGADPGKVKRVADGTTVEVDQAWIDKRQAENKGWPSVDLYLHPDSAFFMEPHSPAAVGGKMPDDIVNLLNSKPTGTVSTPISTSSAAAGSPAVAPASSSSSSVSSPSTTPRPAFGPTDPDANAAWVARKSGNSEMRLESRGGRRFRFGR